MIKAFIFDIGNVLLPFDFSVAMRRLREKSGADFPAGAMEPVNRAYESGEIGRTEFLKRLREALRYTGTEEELVAAWEDIFTENGAMTELVGRLRRRFPLYLLSNTSDLHLDYVRRAFPVFEHFTDGVYSFRVKSMKPERAIYETARRQFGVRPEETMFIDDLAANVATARELGFVAVHYDRARHGRLLAALEAAGVEPG
jgi:putative hydrolase of the HAD superfamily